MLHRLFILLIMIFISTAPIPAFAEDPEDNPKVKEEYTYNEDGSVSFKITLSDGSTLEGTHSAESIAKHKDHGHDAPIYKMSGSDTKQLGDPELNQNQILPSGNRIFSIDEVAKGESCDWDGWQTVAFENECRDMGGMSMRCSGVTTAKCKGGKIKKVGSDGSLSCTTDPSCQNEGGHYGGGINNEFQTQTNDGF